MAIDVAAAAATSSTTVVDVAFKSLGIVANFIGHVYKYFHNPITRVIAIYVTLLLWQIFVAPFLEPLLRYGQFALSFIVYPYTSQVVSEFIWDSFVTFTTFWIVMYIIHPQSSTMTKERYDEIQAGFSDLPQKGFKRTRVS